MTTPSLDVARLELRTGRARMVVAALAVVLVVLVATSLAYGQVLVPLGELWRALAGSTETMTARIVADLRLPRVVAAAAGGAALGLAGLLLQVLFRNPLADPWSLGMTAGGQLGAALVVAAGGLAFASDVVGVLRLLSGLSLVGGAAVGTLGVALAMAAAARRVGTVTLLVMGLMLGFLSQGLMSIVLHFANRNQVRIFASWNDGTFAALVRDDYLAFLLPLGAGVAMALLVRKSLGALLLGEAYAGSLGVNVVRTRRLVLAAVILLSAPVTAYCGPVIFVGLIVPHLARLALSTAALPRLYVPVLLLGAVLGLGADLIVHLPWEQHFLHLNAVLAMLGAPLVIALLTSSQRQAREPAS